MQESTIDTTANNVVRLTTSTPTQPSMHRPALFYTIGLKAPSVWISEIINDTKMVRHAQATGSRPESAVRLKAQGALRLKARLVNGHRTTMRQQALLTILLTTLNRMHTHNMQQSRINKQIMQYIDDTNIKPSILFLCEYG